MQAGGQSDMQISTVETRLMGDNYIAYHRPHGAFRNAVAADVERFPLKPSS